MNREDMMPVLYTKKSQKRDFPDMFASLVPVQVHNAMQSYDARKAELVNMETVRMREATQLMN
uniref:Uncharacterized protein n=2 Tax=Caenorhabditis japonica TaxID=281687 RepID=A0A8R1ET37_CAEJA